MHPGSDDQAEPAELEPGSPRRRLGNFRSPQLAAEVRAVLAAAGVPSSDRPDPARPELVGRALDRLVTLVGIGGNRVWVRADQARAAAQLLREARRRGD